jgi:hypothetical protein
MKRDADLVRALLLRIESWDIPPGGRMSNLRATDPEIQIEGYAANQIDYHLEQLIDAKLVDGEYSNMERLFYITKLTWPGHDFLDSVRDPEIWRETKEGAKQAGGFTIELLGDLAKGLIKTQIEKHTGVKL